MIDQEDWNFIPGLPGYSASTLGHIRKDSTGEILTPKPRKGKYGYRYIQIRTTGRKQFPVRVLIARTFLDDPPAGWELRNKDGDPANDRVDNLEYRPHEREGRVAASPSPYIANWRDYLMKFTAEQRAEWCDIVRDRVEEMVCAEAVDAIMRRTDVIEAIIPTAATQRISATEFRWRRRGLTAEMVRLTDGFVVDRQPAAQVAGLR